jgi:hypothetical protein
LFAQPQAYGDASLRQAARYIADLDVSKTNKITPQFLKCCFLYGSSSFDVISQLSKDLLNVFDIVLFGSSFDAFSQS